MSLITFLDTETTGLEQSEGHRLVEVCMRVYDLDTRKLRVNFVQRINPERSIAAAAQAVHGISLAELAGEPTWPAVAPKVHKILSSSAWAVAHNAAFDMPFVGLELVRIGMTCPSVNVFCTMEEGRWATPNGKLPSLKELCFACDVPYDPSKAHAAEYDVDCMAQSFWRGLDWGFFSIGAEEREAA
ncbi:3'-5' exonuclease [Magnetospirillum molischianum]|uniref:Exonuclease n=1 Tax=Magnetospirillum molischianum DSM 120 TaxID=1150626 RepID=H8FYC7_MAGML|nr:3'-5' exonuclease [Magnetospirillum molischianum]CCG43365.1 Exonuclease [Magnetospirillum molischianum DSM 120]